MTHPIRVILLALLATGMVACASNKKKVEPPVTDNGSSTRTDTQRVDNGGAYKATDLETDSCLRQRVVYFDLDRTEIKGEFAAAISCHGKFLRQFPNARVTLEGNADERGTREYNLGLGERRGNAVNSALGSAGASSSQLNVVSYGEERPTCKDHSEGCWGKNRRVEIVYTAKP
jgi:peptidoglycan-associated lipoprotein